MTTFKYLLKNKTEIRGKGWVKQRFLFKICSTKKTVYFVVTLIIWKQLNSATSSFSSWYQSIMLLLWLLVCYFELDVLIGLKAYDKDRYLYLFDPCRFEYRAMNLPYWTFEYANCDVQAGVLTECESKYEPGSQPSNWLVFHLFSFIEISAVFQFPPFGFFLKFNIWKSI